MFTTVEEVQELTGYQVTPELVYQAQAIIEDFIGKHEVEVDDPRDTLTLGRATAYQAAYMKDNYARVYEQMALRSIGQADGSIILDEGLASPFIAPLAVFALRNLTWRRSKSVRTGRIFVNDGEAFPVSNYHSRSWETN